MSSSLLSSTSRWRMSFYGPNKERNSPSNRLLNMSTSVRCLELAIAAASSRAPLVGNINQEGHGQRVKHIRQRFSNLSWRESYESFKSLQMADWFFNFSFRSPIVAACDCTLSISACVVSGLTSDVRARFAMEVGPGVENEKRDDARFRWVFWAKLDVSDVGERSTSI